MKKLLLTGALLVVAAAPPTVKPGGYDLLFTNARVVDGTGAPWFLADVGVREGKKIKEFGYIDTAEPKPLIRLACQAQARGAVSVVIPPWNGQFGKYLRALRGQDDQGSSLQSEDNTRSEVNEAVN